MATETTDLVRGGGGAEDEALGEAPPREPSSAPALALRNASLQRHAEDEQRRSNGGGGIVRCPLFILLPMGHQRHARAIERARDPTEVGSKARRGKNNDRRAESGCA
ncbi:unnamed protein product [Miscanthus lutarioriparius]|uniref:Uncharacterized protein n=1 Tax=Miscanthus lutarioriparius TaxID=422564 RepID=A0A811M3F3_9POAL|nr:unnamed protein product [Miscanthus lutarioriparius]